ncbi:MAG: hypothetical protein QXD91_04070 [Saccharolobus sp.]
MKKRAVMLILLTLSITFSHIFYASIINVKIYSPFPIMLLITDSQGTVIVSNNDTVNVNGSYVEIRAYVISQNSYSIIMNGNITNYLKINLPNNSVFNLSVSVIPHYAFLMVKVIGKGSVNLEFPNGSIIKIRNFTLVKLYNGSSIILQAIGNLLNWSNGEKSNIIIYNVNGNSTLTAFFGDNKNGTIATNPRFQLNLTDIGLSLFALGFFLMYKIYSRKDQDTNVK